MSKFKTCTDKEAKEMCSKAFNNKLHKIPFVGKSLRKKHKNQLIKLVAKEVNANIDENMKDNMLKTMIEELYG